MATSPPRPPRPRARPALLLVVALLPALVSLGLAEAVGALLGLGASPPALNRGFDPEAAYLVPDPEVPGGFSTQMFDGIAPERRIPARDGRRRVVLFGGSNTESFPATVLAHALESRRSPEQPQSEVINLGRNGYGSERVAILLEQALALDPDLVVVYSGHNEFVEAGFRQELEETLSPTLRVAIGAASHLRTFNALCDGLRPAGGARAKNPKPEAWNWEFARFADLEYRETLERFEAYRSNLDRMVRLARARGVEVVLCTVISNPLAPPFSSRLPRDLPPQTAAQVEALLARAQALVPTRLAPLFSDQSQDRTHVTDWIQPARAGADAGPWPKLRRWPAPVRAGQLLLPPPEQWSPRARRWLEAQAVFFERQVSEGEQADLAHLTQTLSSVLELVPDHPLAHYQLGLCRWLAGDAASAVDHLHQAARFDRAPRKGNDVSNAIVREVAAERGAVLFDAESLYRSRAPDGLIGGELMKDECHLHETAYVVLMHDLADFLARQGWPGALR